MADMDAATKSMIEGLKAKTGRTLEQWTALVAKSGKAKHGEIVAWLKGEHGVTHGYANLIAHTALKSDAGSRAAEGEDLVATQYAGAKAPLRPIYDKLAAEIGRFGGDVEFAPKKQYVSVRRSKQFAIIQPSTATRVDVGLNLKGVAPAGRLEASGSFNSMVTHRVRLAAPGDVNKELVGWLKRAYDGA